MLYNHESENVNKNYKGPRKGAQRMKFENYSRRINSIKEIETFGQKQKRFLIKNNEIIYEEIEKTLICFLKHFKKISLLMKKKKRQSL